MKKASLVVLCIVIGFVIFAILAGIFAAIIAALAQSSWNPPSTVTILLGVGSEILKWILSIWGAIKIYKILKNKYLTEVAVIVK
jgi:membrane-bound metal-dependent hydrolase YbcI (DUF457 family)